MNQFLFRLSALPVTVLAGLGSLHESEKMGFLEADFKRSVIRAMPELSLSWLAGETRCAELKTRLCPAPSPVSKLFLFIGFWCFGI